MRSKKRLILESAIGLLLFLVLLQCIGVRLPGLDLLYYLGFGWCRFVMRVGPQVSFQWELIATAALYAAALVVGSHFFLRWLYRAMSAPAAPNGVAAPIDWKWRWTASGFALVILTFVAGMAAIGIAHQTAWLVGSPEPLYRRNARMSAARCLMNLRQIGIALILYTKENEGKYPDDLGAIIARAELSPQVFICPATNDVPAPGNTPQEIAASLHTLGHCSYIYLGKGLAEPLDANRVIAVEPLENHQAVGMNVLYADMHVEWLDRPAAERLLGELGFERVEPNEQR